MTMNVKLCRLCLSDGCDESVLIGILDQVKVDISGMLAEHIGEVSINSSFPCNWPLFRLYIFVDNPFAGNGKRFTTKVYLQRLLQHSEGIP